MRRKPPPLGAPTIAARRAAPPNRGVVVISLPAIWSNRRPAPSRAVALARYARLAERYERTTHRIRWVRRELIELLRLREGEAVLDVACGAGAMLPALALAVGPEGSVVGVEQSPDMSALAHRAVAAIPRRTGFVRILSIPVEALEMRHSFDACVLSYTHDVLQSPDAVATVLRALRPGARLAIAGLCLADWRFAAPANLWVLWGARHYLTTWHGLQEPWRLLAQAGVQVQVVARYHAGTGYLASGRWPG